MQNTIPSNIYDKVAEFLGKRDFSYTIDDQGMTNIVYVIEDSYILRQSRTANKSFAQEINLLNLIQQHTSISIPQALLRDENKTRFLYKKLEGAKSDVDTDNIKNLSSDSYQRLTKELASFLANVHNLTTHYTLSRIGIKVYDYAYDDYLFVKNQADTIQNTSLKTWVISLLSQYEHYYAQSPKLVLGLLHNDFYGNHFFIDTATGEVTGIIDFSNATIGDINLDFRFLYTPDTNLWSDVIDEYSRITHNPIDKQFVMLNMKIFIVKHTLNSGKFEDRAMQWIENWMKEDMKQTLIGGEVEKFKNDLLGIITPSNASGS